MEIKEIEELMAAMGRNGVIRLALENEGFKLELEREDHSSYKAFDQSMSFHEETPTRHEEPNRTNVALSRGSHGDLAGKAKSHEAPGKEESAPGTFINSPMVGTFYASPSPSDPSFVKVGDKVDKNTVVCIIEAMKVMNEVKAGITGTVLEVLVESGHPVEFGTKLFRIS